MPPLHPVLLDALRRWCKECGFSPGDTESIIGALAGEQRLPFALAQFFEEEGVPASSWPGGVEERPRISAPELPAKRRMSTVAPIPRRNPGRNPEDDSELGAWLRETGRRYPDLAALLGVSVDTLKSWRRRRNPSEAAVERVRDLSGGRVDREGWWARSVVRAAKPDTHRKRV